VKVNGCHFIKALIDTGAAVSVVNKGLVQALGASIVPVEVGSIIVANGEKINVTGVVELSVAICDLPVFFHALYVPDMKYKLILGTNVLRASAVRLYCGQELLWPLPEAIEPKDVNISNVYAVAGPVAERMVLATHGAVIPPVSGMTIKARVKVDRFSDKVEGDVLIEPLKSPLHGTVSRQLQSVQHGYVNVFVTNVSRKTSLVIRPGAVVAKLSPCASLWHDKAGVLLTMDEVDNRSKPPAEHVRDSAKSAPSEEEEKSSFNRRERRAIAREAKSLERAHWRLNAVSVNAQMPISESIKSAKINSELTEVERLLMLRFLDANKDLFAVDIRSTTPLVKHSIVTNGPPIKQRPYRTPHSEKETVRQYIQDSLEKGIISPSSSPWSSPILLVNKKDGTKRFCVDYRKLNSITKKDIFPIPHIEDILERLNGMKFFTKLDLVTSYYQIAVEDNAKEKTAFVTEEGAFEYNVMPFGLTNAPATFQRLMNLVLAGINWKMCLVYIDDILIFSKTFDQHIADIRVVFDRLRKANLKLKLSKCEFGFSSTVYLGHTISEHGVSMDPEKVAAIAKWKPNHIRDVSNVRTFLGMTGYYRRFVPGYSKIAAPLTDLLKKDVEFKMHEPAVAAFNKLKTAIMSAPVLAYPRWYLPFVLQTDASGLGLGAVLTQFYDEEEHPVAYYSKRFDTHEEKYSATEREALAIVEAIKHFRPYLYGTHFTVVTDHKPLEHMDSFKAHNGRVGRWKMTLSDYNFTVVARPGPQNANADALSRLVINAINFRHHAVKFNEEFINTKEPKQMRRYQREDKYFSQIFAFMEAGVLPDNDIMARRIAIESEFYHIKDGVLYYVFFPTRRHVVTAGLRLAVPERMRKYILKANHDDPLGAHQGIRRTYELIATRYYWPNLFGDVDEYVRNCVKCIARKIPRLPKYGMMQPITVIQKLDMFGVDILGPLPLTVKRRNQFVIVFSEYFTKLSICIATTHVTAEIVAQTFMDKVYHVYGAPKRLLSDRGAQFMNSLIEALCTTHGMKKVFTTSYHPQTDGLVERFNHTLCSMLSTFCHDQPREWDEYLLLVTQAYNLTPHPSTGVAPSEVMLGFRPRTFMDVEFPEASLDVATNARDYVEQQVARERLVKQEITRRLQIAREKQTDYYNDRHREPPFKEGDRVWFYWPMRGQKLMPLKLQLPWSGPYFIAKKLSPVNYRLMRPDGQLFKQKVHADRLKLCPSTIGIPTEFIDLHENDTFDPEIERNNAAVPYQPPVITDESEQEREEIITTPMTATDIENFIDFPRQSTIQRVNQELQRIRDVADETERQRIPRLEKKLKKLQHQSDARDKQQLRDHTSSPQLFYDRDVEKPRPVKFAEFDETFYEPMFKVDLYNALKEVFINFKNLKDYDIGKVKESLKLILSSPNVKDETRIRHFRIQVKEIRNHDDLIEFLKDCLVHFVEVFRFEIHEEQKAEENLVRK
jgi:hypothetical protein